MVKCSSFFSNADKRCERRIAAEKQMNEPWVKAKGLINRDVQEIQSKILSVAFLYMDICA